MTDTLKLIQERMPTDEASRRAWEQVNLLLNNVLRLQAMLLSIEAQARASVHDINDLLEKNK